MYAIVETGGKQYKLEEGRYVDIELIDGEENDKVVFDKVVALGGEETKIGAPYVDGATVKATVVKNGKGKKITVFTYKPKKGSARKKGHRQPYTQVKIEAINA